MPEETLSPEIKEDAKSKPNSNSSKKITQAKNEAQEGETKSEAANGGLLIQGAYATEYFRRNGIAYCKTCGEQFHHELDGTPVCPENFSEKVCPRFKV